MTTPSNVRWFTMRKALLASTAAFGLFAALSVGSHAQEGKKAADEKEKVAVRSSVEVSGYTRPGNPDDRFAADGALIRQLGFESDGVKKFKILGGTVYFAVFKNTGFVEGDTFNTGMANFDAKFETGRSFRDSMSPRFDRKAKYLYLYQVVNDRTLDPRVTPVKGAQGGGVVNPFLVPGKVDPLATPAATEEIASFALKLITDPRYITSWGHFRDSSFAANVVDVDVAGKPVKNVVDDGKGNKVEKGDKVIHVAFSYLPAIVTKLPNPAYARRARSHSLGELEAGFGVEQGSVGVKESKAYGDIKTIAGQVGKDNVAWASFAEGILKATDAVKEPDYVQLMYLSSEERAALASPPLIPGSEPFEDELTRAIFRVDWRQANLLRQGSRSVVFGFTSDLPPMNAPIRIDTPRAAAVSEGMSLANYFTDEGIARGIGTGEVVNVAGADGAALALALGTALGNGPTPMPAPAEPAAAGFSGITGGLGSLGGSSGGGSGGGGIGFPAFAGGFSRPGGGVGGGQGAGQGDGGGSGTGQATPSQDQAQAGLQAINIVTNFDASLLNQQQQNQQQYQNQNQNQKNRGDRGHHHHGKPPHNGHVVPAPASLLLGLLGLPGLWFLRRRKTTETVA